MSMEERESAQPPPPGHQSESAVYRPCVEESANPGAAVDGLEVRSSSQCGAVREMDDSELVGVAPTPVPECMVGKRKRGRPAKGQAKAPAKKTKDEEDVCFICFDGGDLVLCDRRGCPKAYHPACIKRDEAFFRSRAQWSCGWHICSCCEKAAHYMCYTCTYSLCKVCVKESEILCVRENKGFCATCMGTIMLIENNMQGDKEMVKIDFDDKSSWEYLFKVYWIYTKGKQSLTLDELNNAKNPWKGDSLSCNGTCPGELSDASNCKGSTPDGSGNVVGSASKRRKMVKQPMLLNKDSQNVVRTRADGDTSLCEGIAWASNELLEFVAHMKGGDTSILSVVDVQALLLKYIKNNNLRDPHQKSQVICDSRLSNLFEKTRVGHIEMLKLLESHFSIRKDSRLDCMKGGPLHAVTCQMGTDLNNANQLKINRDKRCKLHKKGNNKAKQINLDDYAAIDFHNISLIYLRRGLMENLIGDAEKFSDKVVGAFVRIRPGSDQKQDMYRLVQVVGTHKAAAPYKVGQRFTDVLIEVLNLNRREYISIEAASNQDFSEDECRHLRESIRCGLAKCLTVGEIQKKAIALHEVKLTEWLKSEILRVSHLRDRASEKGHRKELRECVEKLQLLGSPEERKRRLDEIPEVHADPSMNSFNETEEPRESDKKADMLETPRNSRFRSKGTNDWSDQAVLGSGSSAVPPLETLTSTVTPGITSSVNYIETDKIWHYKDPFGKIQGPFRMVELRKWNTTGYFPPDLRIWRSEDDSILLTDALDGQYDRGKPLLNGSYFQSQEVRTASGDRDDNQERKSEGINMTLSDGKQGKSTVWDYATTHFNDDSEFLRGEHCSRSSSWDTPADVATSNEEPAGSVSQGCNNALEGNNSWLKQPPVEKLIPSSTLSGDPCSTVLQQGRESHEGQAQNPDQDHENESSHDHEYSVQSSGQNWKASLACSSPNGWDTNSNLTKSSETAVQPCDVDVPKFPSPTPKPDGVSSKESNKPVQESGPSWSTASSLGCGNGPEHPDIAGEWDGYSPTQTTPAVEEWEDSHLVSATLLKLSEAGVHDGTAQDINNGRSIASHDAADASNWQAVVSGPSEFTPVAEKSVSDLLAETMDDLHSPSIMNSDGEFMPGCKADCFGSMEVLSPTLDQGKGDALSSTGDLELGYQPNLLDEPQRSSHTELFDAEKGSSGQSTATVNVEGETKSNGVPMNQCETGKVLPLARTISDNPSRDSELGVRSETMDTSWGDGNLGWGGTAQKNNNVGWGTDSGTAGQGYPNVNRGTSAGYPGSWGSHPKHSGERFYVSRDRGFQNRDLGSFRRGGHSWNKQSSFGGGSPRLPRGQRVCKFHESGRCKKGAFCDYLHP